jgi:hypothetical protein
MVKNIFSKQAQKELGWINGFLEWVLPCNIADEMSKL